MVTISEKINGLLDQRGLLKRDLARALGVSPQTVTDICKGRSAVTLAHLRRLVDFFGVRAEFWLDEERIAPNPADDAIPGLDDKITALARTGLLHADDPALLIERLTELVRSHREAYLARWGEVGPEERAWLRLPDARGSSGRIGSG